jgi:hypothetical protein
MWVIEAQCASILVPHDHLHINQIRMTSAFRSTRSVVPWLTIGGQPPAARSALVRSAALNRQLYGMPFGLDLRSARFRFRATARPARGKRAGPGRRVRRAGHG